MQSSSSAKRVRNVLVLLLSIIIALALFIIFPNTAKAAEEPLPEDPATEDAPVPSGSAEIGEVDVTDGSGTTTTVDTQPEIQQALGAPDDTELGFENETGANAIQQAIDAALGHASDNADITSATVVVEDGTYTGGLTIDTSYTTTTVDEATGEQTTTQGSYNLAQDFVLKIVSSDAQAEDGSMTNSAGGAGIEGDININGINVVLAGLYLVSDSVVKAKSADVSISGTEKDDTITTDISDGDSVDIEGGAGNDDIAVSGTLGTSVSLSDNSLSLDGGDGDDTFTVDTSVTLAAGVTGDTTVTVDGGDGGDTLHLTGAIDSSQANTGTRSGTRGENADITVHAPVLAGVQTRQLDVDTTSVEAYTDDLSGKDSVDLSGSSSYHINSPQSFTDYNITDYSGGSLAITVPSGQAPFLASLVLSGDEFTVDNINAPAFNISISGKCITVDGTVTGKNISITAEDSDVQLSLYSDFQTSFIPDFEFEFSLFDFVSKACITISEDAVLNASETIRLKVSSTQTQSLLPDASQLSKAITDLTALADDPGNPNREEDTKQLKALKQLAVNPNFINVKVGSATISILGTLTAAQSINASAKTQTVMAVTNKDIAKWCIPLGVSVAVAKSIVKVLGSAVMTSANGGVALSADTSVKVQTKAVTGLIPIAIALSVVDAEAKVIVSDDAAINANNGNVSISSKSKAEVETVACVAPAPTQGTSTSGSSQSKSGGFFAVGIVMQEAASAVLGNASIQARDILLDSNADEKVHTQSSTNSSAVNDKTGEENGSFSLTDILNLVTGLLRKLSGSGEETPMVKPEAQDALNKADDQVAPEEDTGSGTKPDSDPDEDDDEDLGLGALFGEDEEEEPEDTGIEETFDNGTSGATDETSQVSGTNSSNQLVGALAVTYAGNTNSAVIKTTGSILAGGTVGANAVSTSCVTTQADGSPIKVKQTSAGTPVKEPVSITGGTITTEEGDTPPDPANVEYKAPEAPAITGGTIGAGGKVTVSGTEVILDGVTITVTGGKTIITGASAITEGTASITVPNDPITIAGGTTTITGAKLTITDITASTVITIADGTVTIQNATTAMTGGTSTNQGGTVDIPSSDIVLTDVTIDNIESFGADVQDGLASSSLPSWANTEAPELQDDAGDPVILPDISSATVSGGGAEITDGIGAFSGAGISLTVRGGNRNADGTVITMADVEITGATLTVSEAYLTLTNGTVTGCTITDSHGSTQTASIIGGVIKYSNGTVTITGATIKLSLVHVTISGTGPNKNVKLSGGSLVVEGGSTVVTSHAADPATTCEITNGKLTTQPVTPQSGGTSFSLGVGVSVGVTRHINTAYIEAGQLSAQSMSITANSNGVTSIAKAAAGVSKCDIGIAGAVAIQVVSAKTNARLGSSAVISGGAVEVNASQTSEFTTTADAMGTGKAAKVGIGAGLAIGVIGADINAIIVDGAELTLASGTSSIESLAVSAACKNTETLSAKAGVAGGKSIVPVLALGVSGVSTNAQLGTGTSALTVAKDVLISSANDISRSVGADAAASGDTVAVGAALTINVYNDNASSKLRRSVQARNVYVSSCSKSNLVSTSKAGANGAKSKESSGGGSSSGGGGGSSGSSTANAADEEEDKGETDKLADKNVAAAALLAGGSGTTNVNTTAVQGLGSDRQTAQTSEGNIKVAAGFALNIQKNSAVAIIGDGLTITAIADAEDGVSGLVAVTSINKTDTNISANASATQAKIGVGVAVAINIVTYDNIAKLGDSRVNADMLLVSALLPEEESEEEEEAQPDNSLKGKITSIVKMFVQNMLDEMAHSIGLDQLFNTSDITTAIADLVEELTTDFIDTMIDGTGLENLFNGDINELINEALSSLQNLPQNAFNAVKDVVIEEVKNKVMSLIPSSGGTPQDSGKSALSAELQNIVTQVVTKLTESFINFEELTALLEGPLVETIKTKLKTFAQGVIEDVKNAALDMLAGWLGTDAVTLNGHTISTEAISGAGASEVGVAGAAAITVLIANTKAEVEGITAMLPADITLTGEAKILADATHVIKTVASSAVGDDGKAHKNKSAEAKANGDSTGGSKPAPTDTEQTTGPDSGSAPSTPSQENGAGNGKSVGVGASFAFGYIKINVEAGLGENRRLTASALVTEATLENRLETVSVSGSDPLADNTSGDPIEEAKDISVDASVAVGLIFNNVRAYVDTDASVTTTGTVNVSETEGEDYEDNVGLYINAQQKGSTITKASGFTVGTSTAVGAAVAVNIAYSNVFAEFLGTGIVSGAAKIIAHTYNEDDSKGIATAVGADTDRYLSKFRNAQHDIEHNTNKVLAGDYSGVETTNTENQTATKINNNLDQNNHSENGQQQQTANNNAPLSANALAALDVSTQSNPDTTEGSAAVSGNATAIDGGAISAEPGAGGDSQQSQKIRVAAALGVNITLHDANVNVKGSLTAAAINVLAENNGNFNAMGTGAAVSIDRNANSIGIGIAVSVNKNEANANVSGSITATGDAENDPDINVEANLTQNMDGKYKGLLGAQALAGSVTGTGSKVCISAAVAAIVSLSKTTAGIEAGSVINGGDISVGAADKSKLAVRAGGLSISTGASVGAGVSFALIFAHNEVKASVGDNTSITGESFSLTAQKIKVDFSDYESEFGIDNMLTYDAAPGDEGIVNLTKTQDANGDDVYATDINFDTDSALGFINLLNFLSSTNYYAESISGAVNTGSDGKLTAAGSFALVFFFNNTSAKVGNGVSINLTEDMNVEASSDTTCRVIAGAVSASASKVGIGATVGAIANQDKVTTYIGTKGAGTGIDIGGSLNMSSHADMDMMLITVAVGASTSGTGVGGTIDVIVTTNDVKAQVADYSSIKADGDINIEASNDAFLLFIALSAAGSGGQAAVGGTFALLVSGNFAQALVGDHVLIDSENGAVRIGADNKEVLISVLAALSGSTGGPAIAATLNVMITRSLAKAKVGDYTTINADGDIYVDTNSNTFMLTIVAALTGSAGGVAVGATINVNVFVRNVMAHVGNHTTLKSDSGDIVVRALAKDFLLTLTAAIAFSSGGAGVSGSIPVVVGLSTVEAKVGENTMLNAQGSVGVIADLDMNVFVPAMSVSVSAGGPGVGATVSSVVLKNIINAIICGGCTIIANANKAQGINVPGKTSKRKGVIVSATASENMCTISISGAGGSGFAVAGVLNTLVIVNKVTAQIRSRERNSSGDQVGSATHNIQSGDEVLVNAEDDSVAINLAGSLAAGAGAAGVGATMVVLVFHKEVTAGIESYGTISADGAITVEASASDVLTLLAITFGAAANVGVAAAVNTAAYLNTVKSYIGGSVTKSASISIDSHTAFVFVNLSAGAGASGTVGVGAVFVITFFYNKTSSYVLENANLVSAGLVSVNAYSKEMLISSAISVGGAGVVGVSGTLNLAVTMVETKAYTQNAVTINCGSLHIEAEDRYQFIGVTFGIGGAGAVGVGVSVQLCVAFNTIHAYIGTNNTITTNTGSVDVLASSTRDFDAYTVTGGGGVYAGVPVALALLVAGAQMTSEAAEVLIAKRYHIEYDVVDGEMVARLNANGDPILKKDTNGDLIPFLDGDVGLYISDRPETQTQLDDAFGRANPHARGYASDVEIGAKLSGSGTAAADYDTDAGSLGQEDASKDDNEEEAERVKNNMDGAAGNAASSAPAPPEYSLWDTTAAFISSGSTVASHADITVGSTDSLICDMVVGTVAVSVFAAVGVGISIAVLNSDVLSYVESGATLSAGGAINVSAIGKHGDSLLFPSDSDEQHFPDNKTEQQRKDDQNNKKEGMLAQIQNLASEVPGIADYTVRCITVTGGGAGIASVNVAASVVSLFTQTKAYMAGNVTSAASLNVSSQSNYGRTIALTLGLGGGLVSVKVSLSLVVYQSKMEASICSLANIENVGSILVRSLSNTKANALATCLGAGAVAVNAASAIALNLTRVDTFIGKGVIVTDSGSINVYNDIDTSADAIILSFAIGGGAIGATFALAVLNPLVQSYIGVTPKGSIIDHSDGTGGSISVSGGVTITNDVSGTANTVSISFAAGGAQAMNGAVGIAINSISGYAAINKTNVSAGSIDITALMQGNATAKAYSASLSGTSAIGLILGIAIIDSDNRALIDTTGSTINAGSVSLNAGAPSGGYNSKAYVDVKTATVAGGAAYGVNVGIAINRAGNRAVVNGSGSMNAASLTIKARGVSKADVLLQGINAGALAIAMSVGVALLNSTQEAKLEGAGSYTLGSLTVESHQNTDQTDDYDAVAHIFSGGGGLLSATAFIAIVKADATGVASAAAASLTVNSEIKVHSYGRSKAAAIIKKASIGGVSIGIMYGKAYAKGHFGAYLGSDNADINAKGVNIYTNYTAYAKADINPATGGFDINYAALSGNVGQAEVNTVANAGIRGSGAVTSSKAISVRVKGTVSAYAIVHGATISASNVKITINVATANLKAKQSAYIDGADVTTTGSGTDGNVSLLSEYNTSAAYNTDGSPKVPDTFGDGATAVVGAVGGSSVELSILTGKANIALANAQSMGRAYISGASTDISGDLKVRSFGTSYANADVEQPSVIISLVNVAINVVEANTSGTFSAFIGRAENPDGTAVTGDDATAPVVNVKAGSISVDTRYNTKAVTKISPSGQTSTSINLASVTGNVATSDAKTNALAYFAGSGIIESDSFITVTVDGTGLAEAKAKAANINISGAQLAANVTKANLEVYQKAYFNVSGIATAAGNIRIDTNFDADTNEGAIATTGSPNGSSSYSISLVQDALNSATAKAKLYSSAFITGGGTVSGSNIKVETTTKTRADADANSSMSATLIGSGSLFADAYTNDTVLAYIGSNTTIEASGNIIVNAHGDTVSDALCDTPGSISLASESGSRVRSSIGSSDLERQTVKAYVGDGSTITAEGDIDITALNEGYATSKILKRLDASAANLSTCIVNTTGYYYTMAGVGEGSSLTSGADITVEAKDSPQAYTLVSANSIGVLVEGGNMYAENTLSQTVLVEIKKDAYLEAHGAITIAAISNAQMYAKTNVNKGGIITAGELRSFNTIEDRNVDTILGNGATVIADYGNIHIYSQAGLDDDIYTSAVGNSAGLVTISEAKSETKVTSDAITTIGVGVNIKNTFNTITIGAYNGEGEVQTIGDFGSGGLSSNPKCRGYINSITSNAKVDIAGVSASGYGETVIKGRFVNIYASLKDMFISAYTHAVTKGFHGTAKAYSTVTTNIDNTINIGNAHISSYDNMRIIASADPTSSGDNIKAYAGTKITAFIGKITSEAKADGTIRAKVTLGANTDITGANVKIYSNKFKGNVNLTAYGKRRALASKHTKEEDSIDRYETVTIPDSTTFHIGDAAAGIVISIGEDNSVRAVGIKNEAVIWTVAGGNITFSKTISNEKAGYLYMGDLPTDSIDCPIYDQHYIPEIIIINKSNLNLVLRGIDTYNESYSRPTVSGVYSCNHMGTSSDTTPEINITSYGTGDVTIGYLSGVVANERGSTTIIWANAADGISGNLYCGTVAIGNIFLPALWTHILVVEGASNIGMSTSDRFHAYLSVLDGADATVAMDASGDIYASLTLADIQAVPDLPDSDSTSEINGTLYLDDIVATGVCDISLPYAVRLKYLAGATAVSLVMPGVLEFSSGQFNILENIDIDDLSRYASGYNPADGTLSYKLPNDAYVYTDTAGKVIRIVSEGRDYNLTNYTYAMVNGDLVITLADKGVSINLTTGELKVLDQDDDAGQEGVEVYLGWDMTNGWLLGEGSVSQVLEYEAITGLTADGEATEFDIKNTLWKTVGGISYYFVYGEDVHDTGTSLTYYIVGIEENSDPNIPGRIKAVYKAKRMEHKTAEQTAVKTTTTSTSGNVTTKVTKYILTFSNFLGSGVSLKYRKEIVEKTTTHLDGSTSTTSSTDYYYSGITMKWVGSWLTVADSVADSYSKLKGVLWKKEITKNTDTEFKGKMVYRTIDKTEDITCSTVSEEIDGETYSYEAFVFDKSGDERQLVINEIYEYQTSDGRKYEIDLDDFTISFGSGYFGFTVIGGGTITLHEGDTVKLYETGSKYRMTKNLHFGTDGTVYFYGGGSYNGNTGSFDCTKLSISNTNDATAAGVVTMKPGDIRLELLSADVAVDAAGNYYWHNGNSWVAATESGGVITYDNKVKLTITHSGGITYHALPDGIILGSDGSISLPSGIGDTAKLTPITEKTDYKVGYVEGDTVTIEMLNAHGSLLDDNDTSSPAAYNVNIRANGLVTFKTSSSGSVGTPSNPLEIVAEGIVFANLLGDAILETDTYIVVPEGDFTLGGALAFTVSGCTLVVDVLDGSLEGNDLYVTNASTVEFDVSGNIVYNNVTVDLLSTLNMLAGGDIISTTLIIDNSTVSYNGSSILIPLISAENGTTLTMQSQGIIDTTDFTVSASSADLTAAQIDADNMTVMLGSLLNMNSSGDIDNNTMSISDSTVNLTAGGSITTPTLTVTGSTVEFDAGGDIDNNTMSISDSTVNLSAGGSITTPTLMVTGSTVVLDAGGNITSTSTELSDSSATMTSGGDIIIDVLTTDDSETSLDAGGNIDITSLTLQDLNGAVGRRNSLQATAAGDIEIDTILSSNSDLMLTSTGGRIVVPIIESYASTAVISAYDDLEFNTINGYQSDITLISTHGGVYVADESNYIKMHDEMCKLTMSALKDIGSVDLHIRMDIPAAIILNILHVDDYYIDAMHIPVAPPPANPVYTGTDENGNDVTNDGEIPNDYIQPIGTDTVPIDFDDTPAEEWAERLMGVMTREQWLTLIADGSISDLIESGSIDAELLSEYLFDDTITQQELDQRLAIDQTTPEWQDTLDWLESLETDLRALLIDTEGLEPTRKQPEVITDEMAALLLALFIQSSVVGELQDPQLIMTPQEIAELAVLIAQQLSEQSALTTQAVNEAARAFNVLVGESTGSAYVTNEGDINITQQTGDMTVGFIDSFRGDVSLTTLDSSAGSILGEDTGKTHIEARNLKFSAAGSIGSETLPLLIDEIANRTVAVYNILDTRLTLFGMGTEEEPFVRATLEADVRYDWLRVYDVNAGTRIDASAGGDITIVEARGNMGLGVINAQGMVSLTAPLGIYDVRNVSETDKNITAAELGLTAYQNGIGTADRYIETAISGHIDAAAMGDIFITDTGDMDMTADSFEGEVNASAENDMKLENTVGDLCLGLVTTGGFADITSVGDIIEGDRRGADATITADGMFLTAAGDIGKADNPFEVDTLLGTFGADCDTLILTEISEDMRLSSVTTTGDAVLTVPGSIIDTSSNQWNLAVKAQKAANEAQNIADALYATASVLQAFADRIRAQIEAADLAQQEAQDAVDAQQLIIDDIKIQIAAETDERDKSKLERKLRREEEKLAELNEQLSAAQLFATDTHARLDTPLAQAQAEADAAWLIADAAQADADMAQMAAGMSRLAAYMSTPTMSIGGSLWVTSGASVGELDHGISMNVDGDVSIQGSDIISISSGADIRIINLYGGSIVQTATLGSLINAGEALRPVIKADAIDLSALGGDVGQSISYLYVCTDEISAIGNNVYIHDCRSVTVNNIHAQDNAVIKAKGSITAGTGPVHISAASLTLEGRGDVGAADNPIVTNVGDLKARGRHIHISNISETLNILGLYARTLHLAAGGNVMGKIKVTDVWIDAFGSIGTEEDPFGIYAPGSINLTSEKGEIHYVNLFRRHYRKWQEREIEARYRLLFIMKVPFMLKLGKDIVPTAIYIAVGLRMDGTWDILGIWLYDTESEVPIGEVILTDLWERGAEQFDFVYSEGIDGIAETAEELFPDAVHLGCTLLWMLNNEVKIAEEDEEELIADLTAVYTAATNWEAHNAADSFIAKWGSKYPQVTEHLTENKQSITEFFKAISYISAVGIDMQLITDTMSEIIEYVGSIEVYKWEKLAVYRAFLKVTKHFPEY